MKSNISRKNNKNKQEKEMLLQKVAPLPPKTTTKTAIRRQSGTGFLTPTFNS